MVKDKIQNFIKKQINNDNKKSIENLVVFLILLIITVIAINIILGDKEKIEDNDSDYKVLASYSDENKGNILDENEYNLEEKLEDILSKMQGVGKTKVLITYSQTSSIIPIYSESESTTTTEEIDSSGGERKQKTENVNKEVVTDGNSDAITKTVVLPKIEGAIVIAEGGGNAGIKANIIQAVAAVTGVATYKVQVFQMEK